MTMLVPNKGYLNYDVELNIDADCIVRTYKEYLSARRRRELVREYGVSPDNEIFAKQCYESKGTGDMSIRWASQIHT